MFEIVCAIQELGMKQTLLEIVAPEMGKMLPKFIKIVDEVCQDQDQLKGVESDDEELFDIIEQIELDQKSLKKISLFINYQRKLK